MFGVLKPQSNLLDREDRIRYTSAYCNLCGLIHRQYGLKSRFLVLHDVATLWWLLDRQMESHQLLIGNCVRGGVGKLKKKEATELETLLAAISVYTISVKVNDDIEDEGGVRSKLLRRVYRKVFERARQDLIELGFNFSSLEAILANQQELESRNEQDFKIAAEPTAQAYGLLATEIAKRSGAQIEVANANQLGKHLGRSVYLADAIRDFSKDIGQSYNPLCRLDDAKDSTLATTLKDEVLYYVGQSLKRGREMIGNQFEQCWHAVERSLLASMGVQDRRSVTLYIGCCIPCGDGAVYVDDNDLEGCLTCCCCLCGLCMLSSGG